MTQSVSHRAFTPDSQVKFQVCQCEVCCGNSGTGKDYFMSSAVCFCPYFLNKYSILVFICIYLLPGGQNVEAWTTSKNKVFLEIGEHCLENIFFHFFNLEATKRYLFRVVSSLFLVFLSPGIIRSQFP
jgi:hypothetical protein